MFYGNTVWPDEESCHGFLSSGSHGRSCLAFSESEENTSSVGGVSPLQNLRSEKSKGVVGENAHLS